MAVRIEIDKDYVLTSGGECWTIYRRGVKEGGTTEWSRPVGHYSDVPSAMAAHLQRRLRESEATSFAELVQIVQDFREELKQLLTLVPED